MNYSLLGYDSNGVNLKSKTYNDNTEYIDEWYLIPDANPMVSQYDYSHTAAHSDYTSHMNKMMFAMAFVNNCYSDMFSL